MACPASLAACLSAGVSAGVPLASCHALAPPLDAFIVRDVLSASECAALLAEADSLGYSFWHAQPEASHRSFRSAETVEVRCPEVAEALWRRLRPHVRASLTLEAGKCDRGVEGTWVASGVNPVLLFTRYAAGSHFSPHTDGNNVLDLNCRSLYSVLLYLNTCAEGGGTTLFCPPGCASDQRRFAADERGRLRWPSDWRVPLTTSSHALVIYV